MTGPRQIAIVGASLAGLRSVEALRRRGYDGTITWIGAELERPYDRPPLSETDSPRRMANRAHRAQGGL